MVVVEVEGGEREKKTCDHFPPVPLLSSVGRHGGVQLKAFPATAEHLQKKMPSVFFPFAARNSARFQGEVLICRVLCFRRAK